MRPGLTNPALDGLRSALDEAMQMPPERFDVDFGAIDRDIAKLRAWLGDDRAPVPPRDASRAALREFVRVRDLSTLRQATLVSFGCIDPFDECRGGLIADQALFPLLLEQVDGYREYPRALRLCFRGLVHAYFLYDVDSATASAQENWARLRTYLGQRANLIGTPGVQPLWVDTLSANIEVLGPDPGTLYGAEIFQGRPERFDQVRADLAIADSSWLVWRVVVGQIEAATAAGDSEFHAAISRLLQLLVEHPLARNFGLAKLLTRYRECASPTLHEPLRDAAVFAWGNPWLALNAAKWSFVRDDARKMVADWLKLALMRRFFNLLAEDGRNDTRRLKFWETYHQSIHAMYFALGDTARTDTRPDFRETRKQMEGLQMTLTHGGSPDNNAFIMCIGEHVVVEFGLKGNACFIFHRDRLPFRFTGEVAGNQTALKHPDHSARLLHKDTGIGDWEEKFRDALRSVVNAKASRPPAHIGERPMSASRPEDRPGMQEAKGAYVPPRTPPFSNEAMARFCDSRNLQWVDGRPNGGNLWINAGQQDVEVNEQLAAWGFRHKSPHGWWRNQE